MTHAILIGLHTAGGLLAFVLGLILVSRPLHAGAHIVRWYEAALSLLVLALIGVVALDWAALDSGTRVLFAALSAFALYIAWRGLQGGAKIRAWRTRAPHGYVDDIGFTLISLFDGFVIVLAMDLGAPVWVVVLIAVLAVVLGRYGLERIKLRPTRPDALPTAA